LAGVKKCWYCGEEITNENELFEIDTQDSGPIQYWHVACAEKTGMKKSMNVEMLEKMQEEIKTNNVEYVSIAL